MQADFALAPSRRERLRDKTGAIHRILDAEVSRADFLTSRRGYGAYLLATLQARRAVESALDIGKASLHYPSWPSRKIVSWLEQDAADLLLTVPEAGALFPPSKARLTMGGVWGALYVLEGSALGARVLQRRVAAIGMTPVFGARHLSFQTSDNMAWKTFVEALEIADLTPGDELDCLETASAAFQFFERAYSAQIDR